jgi:hypothetical protein
MNQELEARLMPNNKPMNEIKTEMEEELEHIREAGYITPEDKLSIQREFERKFGKPACENCGNCNCHK